MEGKEVLKILKNRFNIMFVVEEKLEAFHGLDHAFIFSRGYSSNFQARFISFLDFTIIINFR